jgi:hypothetical protein
MVSEKIAANWFSVKTYTPYFTDFVNFLETSKITTSLGFCDKHYFWTVYTYMEDA